MKKLYSIIMSLTILMMALSCDDSEFETTEDNLGRYITFTNTSASFSENSATTTADGIASTAANTYTVEIIRSASDLSQALSVNINVSVVYATTTDFANAGEDASETVSFSQDISSLTIPAGEVSSTFYITSFNDDFSAGDKTITLTITNAADYTIGNQGFGGSTVITIVDDDCPIDLASFEGEYTMEIIGSPESPNDGFDLCASASRDCSGVVTLTADTSDPLGQTAILTHPSFGGEYKIQFVTCPKETLVVQPMASIFGDADWNMQQGSLPGSYNDASKDISIVGVLGSFGNFTITLKKTN